VEKDASKDTYGRHLFSSRSCEVNCDEDCDLFCTGGSSRRRHKKAMDCDAVDCNDISLYTPSETNGRRRCGPTEGNSGFGFIGADSSCASGHCESAWDDIVAIQHQWNEAAAALTNPTVAFDPTPKDGQVHIDDEEAFRGCEYSTFDSYVVDATTGNTLTEQVPRCTYANGEYASSWGDCDWGGCDEWL